VSRRGWVLFLAMAVIWGVPYLLIKVAVEALHPDVVVFGRTVVGAVLLLPFAAFRRELRPVLAHWRPLLLFAFVEITAPWLLLTEAETKVTSSFAGLLVAVVPLIGAVLAAATAASDRLNRGRLIGLLVGFSGVAALLGIDLSGAHGQVLASVFIILTAVGYAIGPMIIAKSLSDVPSYGVIAWSLGLNGLVYLPFAVRDAPSSLPSARVLWSVLGLGAVCTATAFVVFFSLIAEVGPQRATVITYLNPAIAVGLGVSVRGEPFTVGMAVGFPLVLLGCWLATGRTSEPAAPEASAIVGDDLVTAHIDQGAEGREVDCR
jgi:drug/metabolite transporter (DMT)-like permease